MNAWEEKVLEREEGRAEGLEKGRAEGEVRMAKLCDLLLERNQIEEMKKAMKDLEYRAELFAQFNL